jgi:hypothetical protein
VKVEIEPTGTIVVFEGVHCRVWQGQTDAGVRVELLVARLASTSTDPRDHEAIASELAEQRTPAIDWPRMIALYQPFVPSDPYEDTDDDPEMDDDDD